MQQVIRILMHRFILGSPISIDFLRVASWYPICTFCMLVISIMLIMSNPTILSHHPHILTAQRLFIPKLRFYKGDLFIWYVSKYYFFTNVSSHHVFHHTPPISTNQKLFVTHLNPLCIFGSSNCHLRAILPFQGH